MNAQTLSHRYAVTAEFADEEPLINAVKSLKQAGFRRIDALTPYPVEGVEQLLTTPDRQIGLATLIVATLAFIATMGLQWYAQSVSYPINIGGRPQDSWPAFVPVAFEMALLAGVAAAAVAMIEVGGAFELTHPVFLVPDAGRASSDRFFVWVDCADERERDRAATLLRRLAPISLSPVRAAE